jgi:predicted DNA-binding transcriptional regulator AlpA
VNNEQTSLSPFVRFPDGIKDVIGFCWSRPHIINLCRKGLFPKPYQLSANRVGWDRDELLQWKAARKRAEPPPKKATAKRRRVLIDAGADAEPPPKKATAKRRRVLIDADARV